MSRSTTFMEKALVGLLTVAVYKLRKTKKSNDKLKNELEKMSKHPVVEIDFEKIGKLPLKWPWQKATKSAEIKAEPRVRVRKDPDTGAEVIDVECK